MAQIAYPAVSEKAPIRRRIEARLQAQVSWTDDDTGKKFSISGVTENVSETNALVNISVLPKVGSNVKLHLFDEEENLIGVPARVIRVERDPGKPQAALSIIRNFRKWREIVLAAAQEWVTRDLRLNYEGDDWLN